MSMAGAAPAVLVADLAYYMEWEAPEGGNAFVKLAKLVGCFVAPPAAVCLCRGKGPDGKWWRFDRYTWITLAINFVVPFALLPLLGARAQSFGVVAAQVHALNVVLLGLRYGRDENPDQSGP